MGDIGSEGGIGMERGRERQMGFVARRAVPDTQRGRRGGVVLGVDLGLVVLGAELGVLGVDLGLVALGAELGDIVLGEGAPDIPNTGIREWLWRENKIKIDARYALRAPGRCGVTGDGNRESGRRWSTWLRRGTHGSRLCVQCFGAENNCF
jgi:hypothetical protein